MLVVAPSMLLHSFPEFQRWRRARAIRSRRLQLCVGCTHADRQCVTCRVACTALDLDGSSDRHSWSHTSQADLASKDPAQLFRDSSLCSRRYGRGHGAPLAKEASCYRHTSRSHCEAQEGAQQRCGKRASHRPCSCSKQCMLDRLCRRTTGMPASHTLHGYAIDGCTQHNTMVFYRRHED